jgi:hypothetical protein
LLGKGGRVAFATATPAFIVLSICVIGSGVFASANPPAAGVHHGGGGTPLLLGAGLGPAVLAIPLGMALATGVEAPSNAVAQLQLDDRARRRVGRLTLWLMVGIVGGLTIAFAALAVGLGSELSPADSTLIAEVRGTQPEAVSCSPPSRRAAPCLLSAAASPIWPVRVS